METPNKPRKQILTLKGTRNISLTTPRQRICLKARRLNDSLQNNAFNLPRISVTPTVNDIKNIEIIKAIDGTKLACFFTKFYVFSNHFHRKDLVEIDGKSFINL